MVDSATDQIVGPREFSRLLRTRFGLTMSHQAISKAAYLPKREDGKILIPEALAVLETRGRIVLGNANADTELPFPTDGNTTGRPRAKGAALYDEQAKTEALRREKLQMEIDALRRKRDQEDGRLVDIDMVKEGVTLVARIAGSEIDRLPLSAGEIAAVSRTGGEEAVRAALKKIAYNLRISMGARFERFSADVAFGRDEFNTAELDSDG